MPDLYSLLLASAMVMLAIAVAALLARYLQPGRLMQRVARLFAALSVATVVVSILSHVMLGHRPGSAEGLGLTGFAVVHPAPLLTGLAGLLAVAVSWRS